LAAKANFEPPSGSLPPTSGGSRDGGSSGGCAPDTTTNCMEAGCCKTSGHKCWMKDSETAFCRSSSPLGWYGHEIIRSTEPNTGDADGATTTAAAQNGGKGSADGTCSPDTTTNCMEAGCCKTSGHKCWMKDRETAFCRSSSPQGWYGHEIIRSTAPNSGGADGSSGGHSRITTTTAAAQNGGEGGTDGTCSAAFGQCGGKNWNGPTCCQSGCQCRHEGEWYSQCEPPAGNHMCGGTVVFAEQAREGPVVAGVGSADSSKVVMAAAAMMFVTLS